MNKISNKGVITFIMYLLNIIYANCQTYPGINFTLNADSSDSTKTYVARDFIKLTPGFHYKSETGNSFTGKIDNTQIFPVSYETNQIPEIRTINTGLEVGTIQGNGNVTATGGASYNLAIEVPSGINNLSPNLSIVYNSQSGNGICGWAWHLGGLSAINRMPKTIYHNTYNRSIDYQNDDYSIDGNRIILGTDSKYHTESESFSTITINGSYSNPSGFVVETKSGLTYEYNYQVLIGSAVLQWLVSKITDPWGNIIQFTYNQSEGEAWPVNISYSGSSVDFIYEERDDKITTFANSNPVKQTKILKKIKTASSNVTFREYELSYYKTSDDLYSRLIMINMKGSNGALVNSTVINWGTQGNSITQSTTNILLDDDYRDYSVFTGDFNGDGRAEFIKMEKLTGLWSMYSKTIDESNFELLSSGDFYDEENYIDLEGSYTHYGWEYFKHVNGFCDIDKDGKEDIILTLSQTGSDRFDTYVYLSSNNFTNPVLVGDYDPFDLPYPYPEFYGHFGTPYFGGYQLGDFDNDDNIDILLYGMPSENQDSLSSVDFFIFSFNRDSSKFFMRKKFRNTFSSIYCSDDNGNGKSEICLYNKLTGNMKRIEYNNIETDVEANSPSISFNTNIKNFFAGDFNGDGKTDVVTTVASGELDKIKNIFISTGNGFNEQNISLNNGTPSVYYIKAVCDFSNDGKSDLLVSDSLSSNQSLILYSTGSITSSNVLFIKNNYGVHTTLLDYFFRVGDFNGDGIPDFYSWTNNSIDSMATLALTNDGKNDMFVTKVADGFNNSIKFGYTTLAFGSTQPGGTLVYTKNSEENYPLRSIQAPICVVKEMLNTNGNESGDISTTYTYKNLMAQMQGKGLLGFKEIIFSSPLSKTTSVYELIDTIACYMRPVSVDIKTSGEEMISSKIFSYSDITNFGNRCFYQYVSDISESNFKHGTVGYHYEYDALGNLLEDNVTYSGGDAVFKTYTGYPASPTHLYDCKPTSSIVEKTVSGNSYSLTTTYSWDHGKVSEQSANGVTINYNFDSYGNIILKETASSEETISESYSYDGSGKFIISKSDPLGTAKFFYYNPFGYVNRITDVNNLTTNLSYDGFGRVVSKHLPDGNMVNYEYKIYNDSPVEFYVLETSSGSPYVKKFYNLHGKNIGFETQGFQAATIVAENVYNEFGQLSEKYKPYIGTGSEKWDYAYDDFGRVETESTPDGDNIIYGYTGLQTTISSTAKGSFAKIENHFGQPLSVTENTIATSYSYFGHGGVNTASTSGTNISILYDDYGHQESLTDPNAGTIDYTYNALGQLESQTETSRGVTTTMQYDLAGRCTTKTIGGVTYNYVYDTEYKGALSSVTCSNGTSIAYEYSQYGDLLQKIERIAGHNGDLISKYEYDNFHRLIKKIYPSGFEILYKYDNIGNLEEITKTNNDIIWKANSYNAMMQVTQYQNGNNITTTNTFENNYLTNTITESGITTVQGFDYVWDFDKGNLQSRYDDYSAYTESFGYDGIQRCTSAVVTDVAENQISDLAMSYANNGNISYKTDVGSYVYDGSGPNALTRLTNITPAISHTEQNITYNYLNRVEEINEGLYIMNFDYGADEKRCRVILSDTNNNVLSTKFFAQDYEKILLSGNVTRELHYIVAPNGLTAIYVKNSVDNSDTLYYIFTDHLGSITTITTESGTVLQRLGYDTWGKRLVIAGLSNPIFDRGYTGQEHLDVFGLINLNARLYDPVLGRFLSPDNYIQGIGSQSFNRYSYAGNNPLKFVDPNGTNLFNPFVNWWRHFWGKDDKDPSIISWDNVAQNMGYNNIQQLATNIYVGQAFMTVGTIAGFSAANFLFPAALSGSAGFWILLGYGAVAGGTRGLIAGTGMSLYMSNNLESSLQYGVNFGYKEAIHDAIFFSMGAGSPNVLTDIILLNLKENQDLLEGDGFKLNLGPVTWDSDLKKGERFDWLFQPDNSAETNRDMILNSLPIFYHGFDLLAFQGRNEAGLTLNKLFSGKQYNYNYSRTGVWNTLYNPASKHIVDSYIHWLFFIF